MKMFFLALAILIGSFGVSEAAKYTMTYTKYGISESRVLNVTVLKNCKRILALQIVASTSAMLKFDRVECQGPGRDYVSLTNRDIRDLLRGL